MKNYIKYLKPSEVIARLYMEDEVKSKHNSVFKIINGLLCHVCSNGDVHINVTMDCSDPDLYFEEPDELKVDSLGFYRTRKGEIAYVSRIDREGADEGTVFGMINNEGISREWMLSGRWALMGASDYDLVEKLPNPESSAISSDASPTITDVASDTLSIRPVED